MLNMSKEARGSVVRFLPGITGQVISALDEPRSTVRARGTTGRCRATQSSRKRGHSPLTVSALIWGSPLERRSFSRSRSRRSCERDLGERRRRSRERERERRCRERREREPDRERLLLGDLWEPEPPCSEPDTQPQSYSTPRLPQEGNTSIPARSHKKFLVVY